MELVVEVYAHPFPKEVAYRLTSQMRRSAVSVPSNIAEGKGRSTERDRAVFFLCLLMSRPRISPRARDPDSHRSIPRICGSVRGRKTDGEFRPTWPRMRNALIQSLRNPENSGKSAA